MRNIAQLAASLEMMLQAQKWKAQVSFDETSITVAWEVPNKKFFRRLDEELSWWFRQNKPEMMKHLELAEDYTKGVTKFFFEGDEELFPAESEEEKEFFQDLGRAMNEVLEEETMHPIGSGVDLRKKVEVRFEVLPQIPLETSKVQFITQSDFGQVGITLKFKKSSFAITAKLPKKGKFNRAEIIKKLWSDLDFAVLFELDKLHEHEKTDQRSIDFLFQWECPSLLIMEVAQKIIEEVGYPYGLILGEVF